MAFTEDDLAKKNLIWSDEQKAYVPKSWRNDAIQRDTINVKRDKINSNIKSPFGSNTSIGFAIIDLSKTSYKINLKPMSVNGAWKGRRFKSEEYKAYEKSALSILPNIELPLPPYRINLVFGVSNKASDWDNPVKPIQDILQKRYGFNDKDIYEAFVKKVIVSKRMEYFSFEIIHIDL